MMNLNNEKIQKLVDISRKYYLQDQTQSEIAKAYGVSRPLVSRMLREARDLGLVKIQIESPLEEKQDAFVFLETHFSLKGGLAVPNGKNDTVTNDRVSAGALSYLEHLKPKSIGLGWGHIIGTLVTNMEKAETAYQIGHKVCPLIGNSGVGNRNYHSNELVRIFAQKTGSAPEYFYAPSYVLSEQELKLFQELDSYQAIYGIWEKLHVALVNIGNYPSVPDFASVARYGDQLTKNKAVGRFLNYYLDVEGTIFHSDFDYALQIPVQLLRKIPNVVGICSSNTKPNALLGALRTGLFHHLIVPEEIVLETIKLL